MLAFTAVPLIRSFPLKFTNNNTLQDFENAVLLMPKFSFEWKSTSCNANAINVLFTGREGHTHTHVHTECISCPFSWFAASMMAAQNEVKCGLMESSCPIIFFSFVQLVIPLWAFFMPSTEGGGMKGEVRHPGSLALGHAAHYYGTSWYQKHQHTHLKTFHTNA